MGYLALDYQQIPWAVKCTFDARIYLSIIGGWLASTCGLFAMPLCLAPLVSLDEKLIQYCRSLSSWLAAWLVLLISTLISSFEDVQPGSISVPFSFHFNLFAVFNSSAIVNVEIMYHSKALLWSLTFFFLLSSVKVLFYCLSFPLFFFFIIIATILSVY